jgi:hypothetical protein
MRRVLSAALVACCLARVAIAVPQSEDRETQALQDELRGGERSAAGGDHTSERLAAARVEGEQGESSGTGATPADNLQIEMEVNSQSSLSREVRRKVGLAAGQLLIHVNKAREQLARDNVSTAQQQVDKALLLSRIIESNAPVFSVSTKITSGDLEYDDESTVSVPLVPVYSELTQVVVLGPIVASRHVEDVSDTQRKGKDHEVQAGTLPLVRDLSVLGSTAYLDLPQTQVHLREALEQLKDNNSQRAQALLIAIQQGVVLSYNQTDMPVIQARDNLAIARVLVRQGQIEDARRALNASAAALDKYERQAGQAQSDDVKAVKKEILLTAESVREEDSSLAARIDEWSQQMTEWTLLG